jgi:hypothetical protein
MLHKESPESPLLHVCLTSAFGADTGERRMKGPEETVEVMGEELGRDAADVCGVCGDGVDEGEKARICS